MFRRFADKVHFIHLGAHNGMSSATFTKPIIWKEILIEQNKRSIEERLDCCIPMRPDHGHQMLNDLHKKTNPGYSCIGRLRGLEHGLELSMQS